MFCKFNPVYIVGKTVRALYLDDIQIIDYCIFFLHNRGYASAGIYVCSYMVLKSVTIFFGFSVEWECS